MQTQQLELTSIALSLLQQAACKAFALQ